MGGFNNKALLIAAGLIKKSFNRRHVSFLKQFLVAYRRQINYYLLNAITMKKFLKIFTEALWVFSPVIVLLLVSSLYLFNIEESPFNEKQPASKNIKKANTSDEAVATIFHPLLFF